MSGIGNNKVAASLTMKRQLRIRNARRIWIQWRLGSSSHCADIGEQARRKVKTNETCMPVTKKPVAMQKRVKMGLTPPKIRLYKKMVEI